MVEGDHKITQPSGFPKKSVACFRDLVFVWSLFMQSKYGQDVINPSLIALIFFQVSQFVVPTVSYPQTATSFLFL